MKRVIAIAAVTLTAFAGAASALPMSGNSDLAIIQSYAPDADLSTLSKSEVASLLNVISSGENRTEKRATVEALIRQF